MAQNAHWGYMHPTCKPTSAVTVMHSNGTGYLFYADNWNLYVSEIDPVTLQPLGTDYESPGLWSLQGAYEDFNRNIVVYGCLNNLPWAGLYEVANHTIQYAAQLSSYPDDYFVNGCCGYDVNGNMVNMFVLENQDFVISLDYQLQAVVAYSTLHIQIPGPSSYTGPVHGSRVTDVVWDANNECFDLCGKLVCSGTTFNQQTTTLHCGKGVYCLKVIDQSGKMVVKKMVIL